ncbi:hypothetical protein EVAR_37585_1 [Eumeta japonica]|uniref:Uncharacterized protein n=1 Tax=Eumeta variegata TaxID=151549 RepID=A0A4C1VQR8_EUMVA|nr:hypothetical protein EVAR_37585_1 [Eumeta japonica]
MLEQNNGISDLVLQIALYIVVEILKESAVTLHAGPVPRTTADADAVATPSGYGVRTCPARHAPDGPDARLEKYVGRAVPRQRRIRDSRPKAAPSTAESPPPGAARARWIPFLGTCRHVGMRVPVGVELYLIYEFSASAKMAAACRLPPSRPAPSGGIRDLSA